MATSRRALLAASRGISARQLREQTYRREVRPVVSSTQRYYDSTKNAWIEFLRYIEYTEPQIQATIQDGAAAQETDQLKRYVDWYVAGSKGQLGEYMTLRSAENCWHRLATCLARCTGNGYSELVDGDMLGFIRGSLREKYNLQDVMKEKGYADEVDIDVLMVELLCNSFDEFSHDRTVFEMALLLLLHENLGNRSGAILATQDYTNNYLRYRNMTLTLDLDSTGSPRFGLLVEQDRMKGKKRRYDPMIIFMKEQASFIQCPVSIFIALALADDAFQDISTLDELLSFQPQQSNNAFRFKWREDKMNEGVLKCPERKKSGTFNYVYWWNHLKNLSWRAGYCEYTRPYHIRRAVANRIHEYAPIQSANQVLGHSSMQVYIRHYQSKISAVDVQGLMLNSKQSDDFDVRRWRRTPRGRPAPSSLPAERKARIDSELQTVIKEFGKDSTQYKSHRQCLQARHWREFLNDFHRHNIQPSTMPTTFDIDHPTPQSIEAFGDLRETATRAFILRRYKPSWAAIKDACEATKYSIRSMPSIVTSMADMCRLDRESPVYYPGEAPKDGSMCQFCHRDLQAWHPHHRAKHMHTCFGKTKSVDHSKPHYCYRCNTWFPTVDGFREHCKQHYQRLDMFCGIIRFKGLIAVGGRCPKCMGNDQLKVWGDYHSMMRQFDNSAEFKVHLEKELAGFSNLRNVACPHPMCGHVVEYLPRHWHDDHGIHEAYDAKEKQLSDPSSISDSSLSDDDQPIQDDWILQNDACLQHYRSPSNRIASEEILQSDQLLLNTGSSEESPISSCAMDTSTSRDTSSTDNSHTYRQLSKRMLRMQKIKNKREARKRRVS